MLSAQFISNSIPRPAANPNQNAKQSFCLAYSSSCISIPYTDIFCLFCSTARAIAHAIDDVKYLSGSPLRLTCASIPKTSSNGYWTAIGTSRCTSRIITGIFALSSSQFLDHWPPQSSGRCIWNTRSYLGRVHPLPLKTHISSSVPKIGSSWTLEWLPTMRMLGCGFRYANADTCGVRAGCAEAD